MRTYEERRLCPACAGSGCIDPPYSDYDHTANNAQVMCPCCGGVGYQIVNVRED
jgi:DnaJ-class molecular chaperone